MARFSGMQYCKTDLIATKGIVFVKYTKSSSACLAMETIQETGSVSGGEGRRVGGLASGPRAHHACGAGSTCGTAVCGVVG